MTPLHHLKRSLGTLLALGLILLVSLFVVRSLAGLGTQPAASPPENAGQAATVAGATNTALGQEGAKPAATNPPTPTDLGQAELPAVAAGKRPPACTFPLADIKPVESKPESYTFSEPKVVLTASANISIVEWLPDNKRVLILEDISGKNQQSIELFDPQTGEIQVYAVRKGMQIQGSPVWIEGLNAVVYPETFPLSLSYDNNGILQYPIEVKRLLWLSQGDPANTEIIEDSQLTVYVDRRPTAGPNFTVITNPDGSQVLYSDGVSKQLYQRKTLPSEMDTVQLLPFDLTQWDYRRPSNTLQPVSFKMIWQPGTTQVFLYSGPNFGEYTFLLDVTSGQICELDLFGKENSNSGQQSWAITAHWSPDGRYLAIVQTGKEFNFSDLIILDTTSGKLYRIDAKKLGPIESGVQGKYFVVDVAWAPDNRHLAAIGQVNYYPPDSNSLQVINRLYLIDFIADQVIQVSSQEINSNIGETSLLWSKDGAQLLVKCPTYDEGRLCLISVQKNAQQ